MTKRIFAAILLVTVTVLLLSAAAISAVLYEDFEAQFFTSLKSEAHTIAVALESGLRAEDYLPALKPAQVSDLRVTWVAADGIVRRQSTRRLPRANADVSRAMEIVRLRACDGLRPRDVFAELGISRRLAELRFRELVGHSVQDEILRVRLARVKALLARPNVPLESIAAQCGWKSTAQLRVFFKATEGQSLRQWRATRGLARAALP